MGHIRLGRLPKSFRWAAVIELIRGAGDETKQLSDATLFAAERQLGALQDDPAFSYPFWLLTRLTWASRSTDFIGELRRLGIMADESTTSLAFVSMVSDRVREEAASAPQSSAFTHLAALALSRALNESVSTSPRGIFGASVLDVQDALRQLTKQQQFEQVAQRYFGDFLGRTLTFFLDREVPNALGSGLASVERTRQLLKDVDLHGHQSAVIVRKYAGDWYRKHQWESKGEISREDAHGFVAYALSKLRSEVRREAHR